MVAIQKEKKKNGAPIDPVALRYLLQSPPPPLLIQCGPALLTQTSGEGRTAITSGVPRQVFFLLVVLLLFAAGGSQERDRRWKKVRDERANAEMSSLMRFHTWSPYTGLKIIPK